MPMIAKNVPPALSVLLAELSDHQSIPEMRKRVRSMLRDLRQQAEADIHSGAATTTGPANRTFSIHLHGGLDLLGTDGCQDLRCRIAAAERISRSVGLIADTVWLTDRVSERFLDFGRATNAKVDRVIADAIILKRLAPLIDAGVVRFSSPWLAACSSCHESFDKEVDFTVKEVAKVFRGEVKRAGQADDSMVFTTGRCFEPEMYLYPNLSEDFTSRDFSQSIIFAQVRSALWKAREAATTGGSVFSNSRAGLAGIMRQEGRLGTKRDLLLMERKREVRVPWVDDLNPAQIVQLRIEAAKALPAFRERMARAMTFSETDLPDSNREDLVAELRQMAVDVRAELEQTQRVSQKFWKTTYGLLGLGLSAYGIATDQVMPGVAGLLPVIQLLMNHQAGQESSLEKLRYKPGFVLVAAQDILAHAT